MLSRGQSVICGPFMMVLCGHSGALCGHFVMVDYITDKLYFVDTL